MIAVNTVLRVSIQCVERKNAPVIGDARADREIIHSGPHLQAEEDSGKATGISYRFRGVPYARTGRVPSARIRGYQMPDLRVPSTRG